MSRIIIYIVLLLGVFQAHAQTGVKGVLVDEQGQPIPFAAVSIKATTMGTSADAVGVFELMVSEVGTYTLQFSSIGYLPTQRVVKVDRMVDLGELMMQSNSLGLDEIVVTGTMKPVFVSQSPIKVDIVTSTYLDTYLPTASSSILESVSLVNGVQEVVACGVCFTNSISINGLPGPYTAVLMDGTPMFGNLASVYGLNGIPNMIIDRIEVIKGPSSTLYGSEAVAGVINILTKDPEKQPVLSVDVMGTTQSELFGNFSIAPKVGNSTGYIGLNYGYITSFEDRNNDGFGDGINLDRYGLFTKWNIGRPSGKYFTIAGKYYYEDRRNGVESYMANRAYQELRGDTAVYGESIYTKRTELFGSYQLATEEDFKIDYSFSYHDQDSYYGSDHYVATQVIGFSNFLYSKTLAAHDMVFGLTNRVQSYNDNTVATSHMNENGEVTDQPDNQYIPGLFAQDEWSLSKKSTLLAGLRLDHYTSHGFIWSPRVNYKLKSGDWTTWRVNFGTGFRVVNLFTEDHAFITGQRSIEITEDLQPEESYNLSGNFNHVFTMGRSQGMVDVDAFYTYFTNKIIPDYSDPTMIIYANTNGFAQTAGLGFNYTQEFAFPLGLNLGATLMRATETETNSGVTASRRIEFAPNLSAVFTANYQFEAIGLMVGYTLRYTGSMVLPEVYDLDAEGSPLPESRALESEPFVIQSVQVTKQFKHFSLYGGIDNILDYIQPVSPLTGYNDPTSNPGFSNYFDTSYAFAPIHGREMYLGVKWDLNR